MQPSILALLLSTLPLLTAARQPSNSIRLSDVQSLTLRGHGAETTHRRVSAIPQLRCVSPRALCALYDIDVMRCTNQGSSYGDEDIEWSCTAALPEELKLGSTDIICEGYSSPDDPFILKGSCGVEYRLALTEKGKARYPDLAARPSWFGLDQGKNALAYIFWLVFLAVVLWILYSAYQRNRDPRRPQLADRFFGRGGGGGGGGGWGPGWRPGWGPGSDPPPPYPGADPKSYEQQAWAPGFWSGLFGGAAAGYMAGRHNRDDNSRPHRDYGAGGAASSRQSSYPSSGSPGVRAARHESTGFGSTRRR